jgi:hypothetical protein
MDSQENEGADKQSTVQGEDTGGGRDRARLRMSRDFTVKAQDISLKISCWPALLGITVYFRLLNVNSEAAQLHLVRARDERILVLSSCAEPRKMPRTMTIKNVIGHLAQRKKDTTRKETHHRNIVQYCMCVSGFTCK